MLIVTGEVCGKVKEGKNEKRWKLGYRKWQNFFKVQRTDETTVKNMQIHLFDSPFSCLILSEEKRRKIYFVKTQPNLKKKGGGSNLNPTIADSIGQIKHYFGSWKGEASAVRGIVVLHSPTSISNSWSKLSKDR